ncbi:cytochrome P450 [Phenylobacterium sp. VNQ135]|uniref:cytochrome P450 n=1 Tax=Phenylobacterium sp. VNQ135 TaxID=3400922 RepID=UPI003C04FEE9
MADGAGELADGARERANAVPLEEINLLDLELWRTDTIYPYFERLRRDDPVHLHPADHHRDGPFWSVTRFEDIVAVDTDHETFSSEPAITIDDPLEGFDLPMFIAMDRPKHDEQRKAVSPIVSPANLAILEPLIRSRIQATLDELPVGEPFDWVDRVSIDLTAQMLATLFDVPLEDRRKLTYWSDVASTSPDAGLLPAENFDEAWVGVMTDCAEYFTALWNERVNAEPRGDLISMLAHNPATRDMDPQTFLGNILLLIVGGNDTTRNSMSGSVRLMDRNPQERAKLYANPGLIPSMVSETIRWQTPLAHMRRTASRDVEFRGRSIAKGDKVVMWYLSGNRDETVIEDPHRYIIDRANPRHHLSFGFGIHRCVGNRLAELQLKILWEEIMKRFPEINVLSLSRVPSAFIHGYAAMETVIPRRF